VKKLLPLLVVALALPALSGCTAIPMGAPNAAFLTLGVKGPVSGVDNSVSASKMGKATCSSILVVAMGDASIATAAANGGITKIHHVDCEVFGVLGIYNTYTTIVYGE
jgi:hypothetical protein